MKSNTTTSLKAYGPHPQHQVAVAKVAIDEVHAEPMFRPPEMCKTRPTSHQIEATKTEPCST